VKIIFKAAALMLVTAIATAQTTPAKPKSTPPAKAAGAPSTPTQTAPAAAVAPKAATDTVITVPGLCPPNTPPESCSTKISRAEFEQVISVVNPNLAKEQRREVATLYVRLLSAANEGKKLGLDKDPVFQEQRRLADLQMLAQAAEKKMFESNKPTQQDVESFYTENTDKFEELSLRRIMIPKSTDKDAKPEQTKQLADKIHERAVAGEDPDKLEADAFLATKAPGAPPSTSLGWKRHGAMDPRHEPQIVALKSGQVSEVLEDGQGYYIYKVDSKRMVPLTTVAKDIENALQGQRTKQAVQQILDRTKPQLNDAYFGPAETPKPETPAPKAPAPK
jgi:parvulin-like peptidyl-prolyl isomerase